MKDEFWFFIFLWPPRVIGLPSMAKPGGHYILHPVYFFFFFLISIKDLGNGWGQHYQTFAASRVGAGIERVYLRFPKFRHGGS